MILTCPSCRTRYQTDSAHFKAPGRQVRCAKCGHVWFQATPDLEIEPEPETAIAAAPAPALAPTLVQPTLVQPPLTTAPALASDAADHSALHVSAGPKPDETMDAARRAPRRPSRGAALAQGAGWLALIFLIGAIGWASIQYRETIASLWPQSASLYAVVGMPVNVRGVTLTDISYKQEYQDGQPVLSVTGKIVNISNREQPVPEIRVVLMDDSRRELYHWTFDSGVPTLKAGAQSPFVTRLSSPPPEARNLNVRFAEAGDAR